VQQSKTYATLSTGDVSARTVPADIIRRRIFLLPQIFDIMQAYATPVPFDITGGYPPVDRFDIIRHPLSQIRGANSARAADSLPATEGRTDDRRGERLLEAR
jgi:hypothetical protein